jgi:hypothetical protein
MADFHERIAFMHGWLVDGPPKCFWLPGFFFPQVGGSAFISGDMAIWRYRDSAIGRFGRVSPRRQNRIVKVR